MRIEIIGSGCKNTIKLCELTKNVVGKLNLKCDVLYSTDVSKISNTGLMKSPILLFNNKPIVFGEVPTKEELTALIIKNNV